MSKKLSTEEFIRRARLIHGDKYDYSKSIYKDSQTKIIIICNTHGDFKQSPNNHTNKTKPQGCPKCGRIIVESSRRLNNNDFIERSKKIHNNKYDYSLVEYKGTDTKVKIICFKHGMFEQTPYLHGKKKYGCPKCGRSYTPTKDEFVKIVTRKHFKKYDYTLIPETFNGNDLIKIICPKHGMFEQRSGIHRRGSGCPNCNQNGGKKEINIFEYIKNIFKNSINKYRDSDIFKRQHIDIFIPRYNIGIEYQGEQHFEAIDFFGGEKALIKTQERDQRKRELCKEHGIKLFYFSYDVSYVPDDYPYKVYSNEEELLEAINSYINERQTA